MRSLALVGCLGNNDTDRVFQGSHGHIPASNGLAYYYNFSQR